METVKWTDCESYHDDYDVYSLYLNLKYFVLTFKM